MAFTLINDGGGKFAIQGNNIVVASALDYEVAPSHTLTVGAIGVTPRANPMTFTIAVGDTEEPTINLSNTSVSESAPPGTTIGTLSVAFTSGTPSFSLVDSAGGKFTVSGDTLLTISSLGPLDFEIASSYSITVSCSGVMPLPPTRTFLITVIDVPKAILLSNTSIAEDITNGTVIGDLSVWEGTGTYTFTVVADSDGLFTIDSDDLDKSGVVDYEVKTAHLVTIRADNGAGDVIDQTFTINVVNVDDAPAPVVTVFSPEDDATFVDPDADLVLTLNTTVVLGTGSIYLKKVSDNTTVEAWDVATESGSTAGKVEVVGGIHLTMHLTTNMPEEELYVIWDANVVKNAENDPLLAMSVPTAWSFTVGVFSLSTLTPGAVFAFRKLVTAYAGNCVRIRASGDNVEANFGFVADEVDAAGIAAHVTTHGGSPFIVTWYDQSGIGTDITQATPANQPAFIAAGINGKPTARFDGSNDILAKASVAATTLTNVNETTIMSVVKQDGSSAQNILFSWIWTAGDVFQLQCTYDNVIYFDFVGGSVPGNVNVAQPSGWDDNPHIVEAYREVAGTQAIIVDGDTLVSASRSSTLAGTATFSLSGAYPFKGDISEFIIFKITVGPSARTLLRENMSVRYGITV